MSNIILLEPAINKDMENCKADVLAVLNELVSRVEAGELIGLAYTTVSSDGVTGTGWTGYKMRDLSFGISLLNHRYHKACIENSEQ